MCYIETADFLMKGSSGCHLLNFGQQARRYMFSKAVLMKKKIASIIYQMNLSMTLKEEEMNTLEDAVKIFGAVCFYFSYGNGWILNT